MAKTYRNEHSSKWNVSSDHPLAQVVCDVKQRCRMWPNLLTMESPFGQWVSKSVNGLMGPQYCRDIPPYVWIPMCIS